MARFCKAETTVICTRPSGQGVGLCRTLRRHGIHAWNLPAVRLAATDNPARARKDLAIALAGDQVIFTSPAAVRHALALWPAGNRVIARRIAVGHSTARALHNAGLGPATVPEHASTEGLLQLECLRHVDGLRIAIVGASGGRLLLGDSLVERGAKLHRANVYQRLPARLDSRHWHALDSATGPLLVTLTSGQAITALAARLSPTRWQRLRRGTAVTSSPRLQKLARELGFAGVEQAQSATDAALSSAITRLF